MRFKPILLSQALRSKTEASAGSEPTPQPKKVVEDDKVGLGYILVITSLLGLATFMLWVCAALVVFSYRHNAYPPAKKDICEHCSQCPAQPQVTHRYYNKNRIQDQEVWDRFGGILLFQKYPELLDQKKPEWTLNKEDCNPRKSQGKDEN